MVADDEAADAGVGGPELLETGVGVAVVASDVGILGIMRRKLHARLVCAQLPQQGLISSHLT